jgi:hypothetical protein
MLFVVQKFSGVVESVSAELDVLHTVKIIPQE